MIIPPSMINSFANIGNQVWLFHPVWLLVLPNLVTRYDYSSGTIIRVTRVALGTLDEVKKPLQMMDIVLALPPTSITNDEILFCYYE